MMLFSASVISSKDSSEQQYFYLNEMLWCLFHFWCYTELLKKQKRDRGFFSTSSQGDFTNERAETLKKSCFTKYHYTANTTLLPLQEAGIGLPVGKACPADHHILQQAKVGHLVLAACVVKQHRRLHLVGLYASHVVRLLEERTKELFQCCWPSGL